MKSFTKILLMLIATAMAMVVNAQTIPPASWDYTVVGGPSNPPDMTGVGAIVLGGPADDAGYNNIYWPFAFSVYDTTYATTDRLRMNSNGMIAFDWDIPATVNGGGFPVIPSTHLRQFLSYGGQGDGQVTSNVVTKTTGTTPNRIFTLAFTYQNAYWASQAYTADIAISFYENDFRIIMDYSNIVAGANAATSSEIGINAGYHDGSNVAIYGTDVGSFPTVDTSFTFFPGTTLAGPTSFNATTLSSHEIYLDWACATDVIITYNTVDNFANPISGNSYSVGDPLAGGSEVLYIGSAANFTHTGLSQNQKYYYKIWAKNASDVYSTSTLDSSTTTLLVDDPSNVSVSALSQTQIEVNWSLNSANDSVLLIYNNQNLFVNPADGTAYTQASIPAQHGTIITQSQIETIIQSGLATNTTYYFKIWSMDGALNYSPGVLKMTGTHSVLDADSFSVTANGTTQIDLGWKKNSSNDNILIAWNTTNNFGTPSGNYGVGAPIGGSNSGVVLKKDVTGASIGSYAHTGRTPGQWYYYMIWSYDNSNNYSGGILDSAQTSTVADPTFFKVDSISSSENEITVSGFGSNNVMVVYNDVNDFAQPADGNPYGLGLYIQFGKGTVLYRGNANTVSHPNLPQGKKYYYKVWTYDGNNVYSTPGVLDSATTMLVENPNSFQQQSGTPTSLTLEWALNSLGNKIMLATNSTGTFQNPSDGVTYTSNIGGSAIIEQSTNTSKLHSSLVPGQPVYYKIWSVDGANNYSTGLTLMLTPSNVNPPDTFAASSSVSGSDINLNWTRNSAGDSVLIAWKTDKDFGNPTNGVRYQANTDIAYPYGRVLGNFNDGPTSHTSLPPNSKYYYTIWSFDANYNYSTGILDSATTNGIQDVDSINAWGVTSSRIDFEWWKNNTNDSILIVWNTTNNFGNPGISYHFVNNTISLNGDKVLYNGSGSTHIEDDATKFNPGVTYYFKIYTYVYDPSNGYCHYSSGIVDSATTKLPGITVFPHIEDFEDVYYDGSINYNSCQIGSTLGNNVDWRNIANEVTNHTNWTGMRGPTQTGQTGPAVDHTIGDASGSYVYVESTSCSNREAWLVSPRYNFVGVLQPRVSFWYHMYSQYPTYMGTLSLQVSTDGGSTWSNTLWTKTGVPTSQTSNSSPWLQADLSLQDYADSSNVTLRLKVNTSYYSDIAVDDIKVYVPQNMSLVSSTTEQDTNIIAIAGEDNQRAIRVKVTTQGSFTPLSVSSLSFNTNGTTVVGDITRARVYYTTSSRLDPDFSAPYISQFGSDVTTPSGSFNVNAVTNALELAEGDNYFWLVYDLSSSAVAGNFIDAECASITISGNAVIPTETDPAGAIKIYGAVTIGTGTLTSTSFNGDGPMYQYNRYGAHEAIYTSTEMGSSKEINYVSYFKDSGANTGSELTKIKIYMKNATSPIITNGIYDLTTYTEVYSEKAYPNTRETGWVRAKLDNAFLYDGTSHLHILVIQSADNNNPVSPNTQWRYTAATNKVRDNTSWSGPVNNMTSNNLRPNTQLVYLPPTPMTYASSEVTQPNTTNVAVGEQNAEVIGISITTNNTGSPLSATSFTFTTTGTTNASDLANAKVYYTSGNAVFSSANLFGTVHANPNGTFTITGSQVLNSGVNHFWLAYDLATGATVDNFIDATCTSITVGGQSYTPNPSTVAGNRKIKRYITIGDISTATGDYTQPIHYAYHHAWEGIYLASELGSAVDIKSLAFYRTSGAHQNPITGVKIYMAHTNASTTTSGTFDITSGGYVLVYDGSFPNSGDGWMEVNLSNNFSYNGSSNLSVMVVQTGSGSWGFNYINWANNSTSTARSRKANSWSTPAVNLSLSSNNDLPAMRLEVEPPLPMTYVSSTTLQNTLTPITAGLASQEIIGVKVVTNNSGAALQAKGFTFSTNGTDNTADITTATVYYSGNINSFQASNPFGVAVSNPNGTFTVTGTQDLLSGNNYFWLAYDIPANATTGNYVDAECSQVTIGTTNYVPSLVAPVGKRRIVGALAGEYTIGTGGDYATFTAALNDLNLYGVAGWVKFRVFNGTYTEQLQLAPYTNASASNSVTFEAFSGDSTDVTLQYSTTFNDYEVVDIDNGASFYRFKHMTIRANGSSGYPVYIAGTSEDILISNCRIESSQSSYSARSVYIASASVSNIRIANNNISGSNYGVYAYGSFSGNVTGIEIDSNIITTEAYGLYMYYTDGFKVRNNKFIHNGGASTIYGIYLRNGGGGNYEITGNDIQIKNATASALGMYLYYTDGLSSDPVLIANNFISVSGNVTNSLVGFALTNSSYINLYHNSVNIYGTSTGTPSNWRYLGAIDVKSSTNIRVVNNHLVNSGNGYAVIYDNTTGVSESDYNNIYTTGISLAYLNGNIANLSAWQMAISDDANSISASPSYTSYTDLHMGNNSILNLGKPLTSVTKDIDGNARDPFTPDIGADEKLVTVDMGVAALNTPLGTICSGSQAVEVQIKNYGTNTMYTAMIGWSVDGVTQTPVSWTGNLSTDNTANVSLGNYTFAAGNATVVAWTYNPNGQTDLLNVNDTTTEQLVINGAATVDAGADDYMCYGQSYITNATALDYTSIVWSTSGTGTFTNPGSLNAEYSASLADSLAGFVYLRINVTGSGGCGDDMDSLLLNIYTVPSVSFTGLSAVICPNDANNVLVGTPSGGVFSGPGIVNGNEFSASTAGSGSHNIWYTYTTSNGCSDSVSQTVTVSPTLYPEITNLAGGYCLSTAQDTIYGANPTGGTFSGAVSGTSFTYFNPSTVGIGTHVVTYTVVDQTTNCSFDTNYTVQVYNAPFVTIQGFKSPYCINYDVDTIEGLPTGGTFSGVGMNGDIFDPAIAGIGSHVIRYIYTDPGGCGDTAYQTLDVYGLDSASFTIASTFCNTDASVILTGNSPSGVFTINGVVGTTFDPSTAIIGNNVIEYTVTNAQGCVHSMQQNVMVYETPVANAGSDQTITSGTSTTLNGSATGGSGSYSYAWSPAAQLVSANVQNPQTVSLSAPQNYTLTVTDQVNGCASSDNVTILTTVSTLTAFASTPMDTICEGDTVFLSGLGLGGSGTYSYSWTSNPAGFTSSAQNLYHLPSVNTTYTLTVDDGTSSVNDVLTIVVNPRPVVSFSGLNADYCSNDAIQTLTPSPSFGGAFYGTGVSGNSFNPAIASIGNNDIYFVYTDPNTGCSNGTMQSTTVSEAPNVSAGTDQTIPVNSSATLSGSVTGGANHGYQWTPSSMVTTPNALTTTTNNLSATSIFTLTVTDTITGCADVDDVTIYMNNPNLTVIAITDLDTICNGSQVQLDALASGGSGTYTYQWTSLPSGYNSTLKNPSVMPSIPTAYIVEVNDGSNSAVDTVEVHVHSNPAAFLTGLDTSYCTGGIPTTLQGSPTGGTFSGAGVFLNLFIPDSAGPGVHYIKYTYVDANTGCMAEDVDTTHVFSTPIADAGNDVTISVGSDTILQGGATGGTGNYDWLWTPATFLIGNTTQSVTTTTLNATTLYSLQVTDQISGCTSNDQVVVNVDVINLTANPTAFPDTICEGDTSNVYALAAGGSGSYTYSWTSNPLGFTSTNAQIDVFPTVTTTYTVLVNDGINSVSKNVTVVVNPKPNVSSSGLAASYCSSDALVLMSGLPTGGVFAGQGVNGNTFDPLAAGAGFHQVVYYYTDTITGCSAFDLQATFVTDAPIANAGNDVTIDIGNDTILYGSSTGGANQKYTWSPSALVTNANSAITNTTVLSSTTIFTLTVQDTISGCQSSDDVMVEVFNPNLFIIDVVADQYTICEGDSAQLIVTPTGGSGPISYVWTSTPLGFNSTDQNPYVSPTFTTQYSVTATRGTQTATGSVIITVNSKPTVMLSGLDPNYCIGSNTSVLSGFPSGGTYTGAGLTGNLFDPALAGAGSHDVIYTFTNALGCSNSDTANTIVYDSPVANAGNDVTIAFGSDTILYGLATGGSSSYIYNWSPAGLLLNNLAQNATTIAMTNTTLFTLTVEDQVSGCTSSDNVKVTIGPSGNLHLNPIAIPDTICSGSSSDLDALAGGGTGTYNYLWVSYPAGFTSSSANPVVSPTVTTTYYVQLSDGNTSKVDSVVVVVDQPSTITINGYSASYCENDAPATFTASPSGGVFVGSGMSGNVFDPSVAGTGTHQIQYIHTSGFGCVTTETISVTVVGAPNADAGSDIVINCGGGGLIGSPAQAGLSYSWNPPLGLSSASDANPMASPTNTTLYTLTVQDNNTLCQSTDDVLVQILNGPQAVVANDTIICQGSSVNIWASGGTAYQWSNGVSMSAFTATPAVTATYYVTVTDGLCGDVDSVTVTVSSINLNLGPDLVLIDTNIITLDAGFGYASYQWSTGNATQAITVEPYVNAALGVNSYSVTVTDPYGCSANDQVDISYVLGMQDIATNLEIEVFPNPSNGIFELHIDGEMNQSVQISITNTQGQLLQKEEVAVHAGQFVKKYDLSHFAKGVYLLQINHQGYSTVEKIVIQ